MQFQVPQYIDIEDKVIGPLTIRQFLYLLAAGAIVFVLYTILNLYVTIILAIPIAVIAFALGFIKVNNQPFINAIKNLFGFLKKPDFYVWKKQMIIKPGLENREMPEIIKKESPTTKLKPLTKEHLQEINWKVEIEK